MPVPVLLSCVAWLSPERKRKRIPATQLLRLLLGLGLLFLFAISAITPRTDSFLDSLTEFLASTAHSFTKFLACRNRLTFLHLVANFLATLSNLLARALKIAAFRLRPHSEFARSLGIETSCDGQILRLLILANTCAGLGTYDAINLSRVVTFVAQSFLHLLNIATIECGSERHQA